jgi:hypothetical protein
MRDRGASSVVTEVAPGAAIQGFGSRGKSLDKAGPKRPINQHPGPSAIDQRIGMIDY